MDQRCSAVILAGGEGARLRALTRELAGDDRPEQFCRVLGADMLLEQTRRRAVRRDPGRVLAARERGARLAVPA
jgi:mannose-1-phosphate guanylyltransferase